MITEKSAIRQHLLSKRLNLSEAERTAWDQQIFQQLISCDFFKQANHFACYFSHLNEPQLVNLILDYIQTTVNHNAHHQSLYLPILKKSEAGSYLSFGRCDLKTRFKNNLYNIPEPDVPTELELNASELDLILMPLVGFTSLKKRLGMGGGFYDRTLSFKLKTPDTKPYLVGIAYECQKSERIPIENHDIGLDNVITESRLY